MRFSIVKDPKISANDLNHDLDVIHQWAHQWKLEFNPDPNKQATEVLFLCETSIPSHPQILFNGTVVAKMNEYKHFRQGNMACHLALVLIHFFSSEYRLGVYGE